MTQEDAIKEIQFRNLVFQHRQTPTLELFNYYNDNHINYTLWMHSHFLAYRQELIPLVLLHPHCSEIYSIVMNGNAKQNTIRPLIKMARLKQAGLNPHLVYGNGASVSVGNMNQPAQVSAPQIDTDFQSKINAYTENELRKQQASVQYKQQEVQEAQINLIKAQEFNTLTNANKTALDTQFSRDSYNTRLDQLVADLTKTGVSTANIKQNTELQASQTQLTDKQRLKIGSEIENIKASTRLTNAKTRTESIQQALLNFEKTLNQMGFTKTDPVYIRMMKSATDTVKDNPSAWEEIKNWFGDWWSGDNSNRVDDYRK